MADPDDQATRLLLGSGHAPEGTIDERVRRRRGRRPPRPEERETDGPAMTGTRVSECGVAVPCARRPVPVPSPSAVPQAGTYAICAE